MHNQRGKKSKQLFGAEFWIQRKKGLALSIFVFILQRFHRLTRKALFPHTFPDIFSLSLSLSSLQNAFFVYPAPDIAVIFSPPPRASEPQSSITEGGRPQSCISKQKEEKTIYAAECFIHFLLAWPELITSALARNQTGMATAGNVLLSWIMQTRHILRLTEFLSLLLADIFFPPPYSAHPIIFNHRDDGCVQSDQKKNR